MEEDIDKFSGKYGYLNSFLSVLSTLTINDIDNPINGQAALDCELIKKLNGRVSKIPRMSLKNTKKIKTIIKKMKMAILKNVYFF